MFNSLQDASQGDLVTQVRGETRSNTVTEKLDIQSILNDLGKCKKDDFETSEGLNSDVRSTSCDGT